MQRPVYSKKRIGICGGRDVDQKITGKFCYELGKKLAQGDNYVLVSAGYMNESEDRCSVDWFTIKGAMDFLKSNQRSDKIYTTIETILPDDNYSKNKFQAGNVIKLHGKSRQARRFAFVSSIDVLVAIEGNTGTDQNIELALALNIPILPVPNFGGKAMDHWNDKENHHRICKQFKIKEDSGLNTQKPVEEVLTSFAEEVSNYLVARLKPSCMIIMPFHKSYDKLYKDAIVPALEKNDFLPIRTDQLNNTGDIMEMIHHGIYNCDCAIAVITELRPNVMYELGLAHAFKKPVLILMEEKQEKGKPIPFDIDNHAVIKYADINEKLTEQIFATIQNVRETYLPGRYLTFRD